MKKLIVLILLTVFTVPCSGYPSAFNPRSTFRNAYAWSGNTAKDNATKWAQGIEGSVVVGGQLGTGSVFYVDSNSAGGNGLSWLNAVNTVAEALSLAVADRGDFILVAQGDNESFSTVSSLDVNVAGVTIRGYGNGSLAPTFDYDIENAEIYISAPNVTLQNLRFRASVTEVKHAIHATAAADYFTIENCVFGLGEVWKTDEFLNAITIAEGCDYGTIKNCLMEADEAGATSAVLFSTVSGLDIIGNKMTGDYSVSVLKNDKTASNVFVAYNVLYNGNLNGDSGLNAQPVIEFAEAGSGFVHDNRFASANGALSGRVADDFTFMNNFHINSDGDEFEGVIAGQLGSTFSEPSSVTD